MNKTHVQALSENTRKAIIIAAIVAVAVIILSISLALILRPSVKLPDDQTGGSTGSSSLTIRNGDFAYTSSDDTAFPKTAQNWTRYGYKAKAGSDTHDFETITTHEKAVMGIVDTDNWDTVSSDLEEEGLAGIDNPGRHDYEGDEPEDNNVYMIATKEATAASILSDSFSVSSGTSVKITLWINTAQLADGSKAVVMLQKSTVSALSKYWYAYNFEVGATAADESGWQQLTFYIFNRESSTQYVRISIGIGNVYSGEDDEATSITDVNEPITGEGVLFVDDIMYETVTANDYRKVVDSKYLAERAGDEEVVEVPEHSYKVLENVDIEEDSTYLELVGENGAQVNDLDYDGYLEETKNTNRDEYSPFTMQDDFVEKDAGEEPFSIYKATSPTNNTTPVSLRLKEALQVSSNLILKDHHHISFWVRVYQENENQVARANIHVQKRENGGEWEDLASGSWLNIITSQDIDTDSKAGWVKYDIYIKPASAEMEISVEITFGDEKKPNLPIEGSMYVTKPAYEQISYKDYNNASSGSYVKKFDLVGSSATASVTNGSFSSLDNTGLQPTGWTPVFAGDNSIYNDGLGNQYDLNRSTAAILGSGVEQQYSNGPTIPGGHGDDDQKNVLKISIDDDYTTSFGYLSSTVTLYAKTAYVISVLAKGTPYIYLLNTDNSLERSERVIASIEATTQSVEDESVFGEEYEGNLTGWTRYYFVIVTGAESQTLKIALFNGSLDGETSGEGEVYYDQVEVDSLATYSLEEPEEDEDAEEADSEETVDKYYDVKWTACKFVDENMYDTYGEDFGEMLEKGIFEDWGVSVEQPDEDEWLEIRLIPADEEEEEEETTGTTTEPSEVDLGLLFSVISSVALVAALLVVIVLKLFKNGKFTRKAA